MNKNKKTVDQLSETKEFERDSEVKGNSIVKWKNNIVFYTIALAGFLSIGMLIGYNLGKGSVTKEGTVIETVKDDASGLEVNLLENEMSNSETKEAVNLLMDKISSIKNNNGYVQAVHGEDIFDTYVYSSNGEIVCQDSEEGGLRVYRNDGEVILISDSVSTNEDIDILTIAENSLKAIGKEGVKLYSIKNDLAEGLNDSDKLYHKQYAAYFNSYEAIKLLYNSSSEEFANNMVESIKAQLTEEWEPCFKFYYIISDDGAFTVSCHLIDTDGKEYTNWYVDGYINLYDWELSNEWYTVDITDVNKVEELSSELLEDLSSLIGRYAEENGIDLTGDSIEEGSAVESDIEEDVEASVENSSVVEVENIDKNDSLEETSDNVSVTVNENGEQVTTYEGTISLE